jgi:hypothetical protein
MTLNKTNAMLKQIESGQGVAGRFIYDEAYATQLTGSLNASVRSLETITGSVQSSFENNTGALPALLNDAEGRRRVVMLIENLEITSARLAAFSEGMEKGQGLVPRLMNDQAYADETLKEFSGLVRQLSETAHKLNEGEGTAGKLISDPAVYESINDILIGINESRMLRWLIRNRQGKGIETRYERAREGDGTPAEPQATPVPEPADTPVPAGQEPDLAAVEAVATPTPTP